MAREEGLVTFTLSFESLQFGGDIDGAVAVVANIKRYDTDGVAGNEKLITLLVVEGKSEDTAEVLKEIDAFLTIERKDNLTVRTCLELILSFTASTSLRSGE